MTRFISLRIVALTAVLFALTPSLQTTYAREQRSATTAPTTQPRGPVKFVVTFPKEALAEPFSGRVVVYLSARMEQPRFERNWFRPEPKFSVMVTDIKPGEPITIENDNAVGFPGKLADLERRQWIVQAVVDRNLGGRTIGGSPGNLYSGPMPLDLRGNEAETVNLVCDQVVAERAFVDTENVKYVKLRSKLLSDFYHRDTFLKAAVTLPEAAVKSADDQAKFPTVYIVPGFGGGVEPQGGRRFRAPSNVDGIPFASVMLDPNCPTGHTVFADSDNNGPWGAALTTELIPEIERRFPIIARPDARFVTGHSSGGWSSLWLQIKYPDVFGGCWSTAPDPVDFRDFQLIDLYKPNQNMFTDEHGQPRPMARRDGKAAILYKQFADMERPIRGEQIGSFEAVFGGRGANGEPAQLFDRDTGAIDPNVVEQWKRYDIGLILREHWNELAPKLAGRIHVYMGETDTYFLDGAVRLLQSDMKKLNADAVIELVPGDHSSMMTPDLRQRINREMADQYRKHAPADEVKRIEEQPATTQPATTQPTRKAA